MYRVSVIVPIYNSEENLNRCLDSIKNQTYSNLEIITVDCNSTDNSKEIARGYARFDKRFRLLNTGEKELSKVVKYATEKSTGQFILYVNPKNSWLDKNMIQIMVQNQDRFSSDAIQVDSYDVYFDKILYDDKYLEEDGKGLILDNKSLMEELNENERVKNNIWGKLYNSKLIKNISLENMNDSKYLFEIMSMIERYIILHKPAMYNLKES